MKENEYNIIINADHKASNTEHCGCYNAATNAVVVVIVNQECDKCNIVIHARDDRLHWTAEAHQAYNALHGYGMGITSNWN